jgi:hypothetical protein
LVAIAVTGCGAPTPTSELSPVPTPSGPLTLDLTTDANSYPASGGQIQVTLTNHADETVYLALCAPMDFVQADTLALVWDVLCEIDYLGHKIEPGESFADSIEPNAEPGTYRIQTMVYAGCTLGEPRAIGPGQTNYGDFRDCTVQQKVVSEPFDVK